MRRALRLVAVLLVVGGVIFWLAKGANRGWTITDFPQTVRDDVTGVEATFFEKRFIPGKDFVLAILVVGGVLTGASFLFRNKKLKPGGQSEHH